MHGAFVGRVAELEMIVAATRPGEAVTVTGPGGVGKTETARRAAELVADRLGAARRVIELAGLTEASAVTELLDRSLDDVAHPVVVLVDNAEHVSAAVRDWARQTEREQVALLVTSRTPLGLRDERVIVLPLLGPDEAVALFNDRAVRAGAAPGSPSAVAALCARLDFLPLAIELAAARSRTLSPDMMRARLDDRFAVLGRNPGAAVAHHESLQAAIGWSYDLLDDNAQSTLDRLAVFADRFGLVQAEHVGVGLDAVDHLIAHSLVASEPDAAVPYRLLESIRAFAQNRLRARGDETPVLNGLVAWLAEFTAPLDEPVHIRRDEIHAYLDVVAVDVRRAIEHAIAHAPVLALHLVGRIGAWFWDRGRVVEGLGLAQAALDADTGGDGLARGG